MIIEGLLKLLFDFGNLLVGIFPNLAENTFFSEIFEGVEFFYLISVAGYLIIPSWLFSVIMTNVVFWLVVQMFWAAVEWVYQKIPGVN